MFLGKVFLGRLWYVTGCGTLAGMLQLVVSGLECYIIFSFSMRMQCMQEVYAWHVLSSFSKCNLSRLKFSSMFSFFFLANNLGNLHDQSRLANEHFLCWTFSLNLFRFSSILTTKQVINLVFQNQKKLSLSTSSMHI